MYMIEENRGSAAGNLAYEYCLMEALASGRQEEAVLCLWQNEHAVVIGRNQNPYKECDMNFLRESGAELVRRVTGGGAVYHDLGNLNYSFICRRECYDRERVFACLVKALEFVGISGRLSGRNDVMAGGFKVSGNAFYTKAEAVLHHGTILVKADMEKMKACLTPCEAKLKLKGIGSVKGRVTNLADIRKDIDVSKVKRALFSAFGEYWKVTSGRPSIDEALFEEMRETFSSEEWTYGDYPSGFETVSGSFEWGNVVLGLSLKDTVIERCYIESDSLCPEALLSFEACVKGMGPADIPKAEARYYQGDAENDIKKRMYRDLFHLIREKLSDGSGGGWRDDDEI